MWGRAVELKKADAAPAAATQAQLSAPAGQTTAPTSRRRRPATPAGAAPAAEGHIIAAPGARAGALEQVAPVAHIVEKAAAAAPAVNPAAGITGGAPASRRARRAQTGQFGAVSAPIPAASDETAPRAESDVAERPFELLEPLVESETAPIPAAPSSTARATGSSGSASTWMGESFARILAAEAVATAATTAPLVETAPAAAPERPATPAAPQAPAAAESDADETRSPRPSAEDSRPATERIHPLTGPIPQPAASDVDEFEAAARLFEFTGETPVQQPAAEQAAADSAADAPTQSTQEALAAHAAPRRSQARRGAAFRRVATASFSVGVFGIVGLMAVGMTTPAEAVAAVRGVDASLSVLAPGHSNGPLIDEAEIQAYVAPAGIEADTLDRPENYTTTTTAQLASEAGIKNFSNLFRNDPNSNIQWPFTVGVTMSYGFGMRSGRMHEGVDFTPGAGAPIQAIADGTVRVASEAGGAYGVHVIIDHIVDGQLISSHYAHMEYGSLQVSAGQHVTVGTVLGRTGNTGRSYGAHTHFELLQNGTTAIDPMPWLRTYTDGTHTVG